MTARPKESFPYTSQRKGVPFRPFTPSRDFKTTLKAAPLILVLFVGIAIGLTRAPFGTSRLIASKGGEYGDSLERALGMISSGDFTHAAQTASAVIRVDPHNAMAHHVLGLADARRGLIEEAVASFEKAVELDPESAVSWFDLGMVEESRGEFTRAFADYRKASELEPSNKTFGQAVERLDRTLTGDGIWASRESEEGNLLLQGLEALSRGDAENLVYAENIFRDIIEKRPYDVTAKNMLGMTLARRGLLAEAERVLSGVVDTEPGYADAWFNLGMVHAALAKNDEALRDFEKAYSLADNDSLKAASTREIQSINIAQASTAANSENSEASPD